ncbi:winged helix-turn-helix domain-containing protein [uncultured Methanobrevibacter sp.]|uniref:winged helix-turn-helix domain-containing protein n=1 Tax=uncultured Methanobrevibacter sp. TaxID=253161 RepID=UPI0025F40D85|nr:winged helix-turn-helix domain-containing protein [uncultured Methanobrevibacter sp.]
MSNENDELLKLTSYVQISKYREKTLKSIGNDVKIPTHIAEDSGIRTNHISKVLTELKNKEIVECINEEARKGRLYRLTDTGKDVLKTIEERDEIKNKENKD